MPNTGWLDELAKVYGEGDDVDIDSIVRDALLYIGHIGRGPAFLAFARARQEEAKRARKG